MTNHEFPSDVEVHRAPRAWLLLDLDGVVLRWVNTHTPDARDQGHMLAILSQAKEADVGIAVLTNRPPGAMPAIAYTLGINYGVWVTESGGSLYDVFEHKACVASEWMSFIPHVHALRGHLKEQLGIRDTPTSFGQPQFEPGMGLVKTVVIPPAGETPQTYADGEIIPTLSLGGFDQQFAVHVGKGIDIDPRSLSKEQGMETLLAVNGIDPAKTPALWIADHDRDIAAGTKIASRGGQVAAVGNASDGYRAFVESYGGIIAPAETSYHSSVAHIVETFMTSL